MTRTEVSRVRRPATHISVRVVVYVLAGSVFGLSGCAIVGGSCLERQERGGVTSLAGEVDAGRVASHLVPYDRRGSQNQVSITWTGRGQPGAPRLRIYATPVACTDILLAPAINHGACAQNIGSAGGSCARPGPTCSDEDFIQGTLIVAMGPGNGPDDFTQYRLHVVGDPREKVAYYISISYFSGPDC